MSKKFLVIGSGISALGSIKALNKEGIYPDVYVDLSKRPKYVNNLERKRNN